MATAGLPEIERADLSSNITTHAASLPLPLPLADDYRLGMLQKKPVFGLHKADIHQFGS
jgi:hypothetical protein